MARRERNAGVAEPAGTGSAVAPGSLRACAPFRGELARHRVVTADGLDYVVATGDERSRGRGFVTAAYPVSRGYLVMLRQPLCELASPDEEAARRQHELLATTLVRAGTGVVRARRRSAALRRAERSVDHDRAAR
jgi:hypothetical protein